jgi:hypothetical protein
MPSVLPSITTGIGAGSSLLLAVPQIAGLLGNSVNQTIGYQPQGVPSTAAANILGLNNSTLNTLFSPLPAMLFNYEGDQTMTSESDVTDHFAEDNSAIHDQVSIKPLVYTTQGYIGELNNVPPNTALQIAQVTANKLTVISQYTPGLSATALEAYNQALFLYQTAANGANAAVSAYNSLSGSSGESVVTGGVVTSKSSSQNKQQLAWQQFLGYQATRTLFTIQTPWAVVKNCVIMSMRSSQDANTQVVTEFSITFKQLRFASSLIAATNQNNGQPVARLSAQAATSVNNGSQSLTTASSTTSSQIINTLAGQ